MSKKLTWGKTACGVIYAGNLFPKTTTKSLYLGWLIMGGLTVATSNKKPPQTAVMQKLLTSNFIIIKTVL